MRIDFRYAGDGGAADVAIFTAMVVRYGGARSRSLRLKVDILCGRILSVKGGSSDVYLLASAHVVVRDRYFEETNTYSSLYPCVP